MPSLPPRLYCTSATNVHHAVILILLQAEPRSTSCLLRAKALISQKNAGTPRFDAMDAAAVHVGVELSSLNVGSL